MTEWNLSVRLTGQGSDLSATLKDGAKEAGKLRDRINEAKTALTELRAAAANPITVRLDLDADHLRSDVDAALATASGRSITARLDIDADHLRDDVSAALTTAGSGQGIRIRLDLDSDHLRDEVNAAVTTAGAGQGLGVRLTLTDTMQLRRDVENAVRWAAWGHRIEIPIGLRDPMQLRRDVTAAVRWASMRQTITIRTRVDRTGLTLPTPGGGGSGGGSESKDVAELLKGLLLLAPAIIPVVAGLGPLVAGLAASGVAAGAFGIALAGQIGPLGEAADAEKKYQDAVTQHGAASKEAAQAAQEYRLQLAALPPDTQKAAMALSILKNDFADWSDGLSRFTMTPVTKGIGVLDALLPHLTPEVESFSGQLDRLVTTVGGTISTPGFDALSDKFADFSARELEDMTDHVIHLMRVLSEGKADGPLAQFLDYIRENGPAGREALQNIAEAAGNLAEGAAQAGPGMLTLVNAAAKLVAALPPELVALILQVAAAFKIMKLAGAGAEAISGGIRRLSTEVRALAATSTAAGGGVTGLRAAVASLSTGAKVGLAVGAIGALVLVMHELSDNKGSVEVDALSTSLNTLIRTGKMTGTLKTNIDDISSSIAMVSKGASDNKFAQLTSDFGTWVGISTGPGISTARKNVDAWDKSMANLVKGGHPKEAAAQYDLLKRSWKAGGGDMGRLKKFTDDYNNALADQKFESQMAAEAQGVFGTQAQAVQTKLDAQKSSADGLRQSIQALNDVNRAAGSAMSAFEQAIDDTHAAISKNAGALAMQGGELNLGSQKARDAEKVLSNLASSTDAATAAAKEQGKSWEYVNGIYTRGKQAFIDAADSMGLTKTQAKALAEQYLKIPDSKTTKVEMQVEDAQADLDRFNAAVKAAPGSKSVTLKTLSKGAEQILESFGYKVKRLPDGSVKVSAATGGALSGIRNVAGAIAALRSKSITITTNRVTKFSTIGAPGSGGIAVAKRDYADGGIADYYANGGIQRGGLRSFAGGSENHIAQIAPAGSWRVWGEPETMGEGYVPFAASKRPRSRKITEEIVRRLGGDPNGIQWNADGGVTYFAGGGFTYNPTGTAKTVSDVQSTYSNAHQSITKDEYTKKMRARANAVDALHAAESRLNYVRRHHHTHAQLEAAENRVAKARRSLATATDAAKNAEARYKKQFSLSDWDKTLASAVKANKSYEANLSKIASRGGADVIDQLRDMGAEGAALVAALAKASNAEFKKIVANLEKLGPLAKATLADYTKQMTAATKVNAKFQADLATLAGMGFGDLATQLAGQGDEAAQKIAAEAVKSKSAAGKANAAAKANANALSSEQVTELVQIIAAIKTSKTGIHAVAGTTGLGEDEIITVANKAKTQITKSLGSRATQFLSDLGKANKHLAYADGGIRSGIYATQNGAVTFAEPSTGGEAFIPLGANKRRSAMPVLSDVAHRFGVGLTDVSSSRPVVIVRSGDTVTIPVTAVRTGASASDIGAQVGRSYRRARRGGVAARAY
ncbi:hypothetical protein [Streptomyces sp. NPDC005548]|uniref:hypothetical protein n=1 Tax=Streptomyces sp. NPDC005548 TaxID=3364724 RepID=UPI00369BE170